MPSSQTSLRKQNSSTTNSTPKRTQLSPDNQHALLLSAPDSDELRGVPVSRGVFLSKQVFFFTEGPVFCYSVKEIFEVDLTQRPRIFP
jgi:hypothetical protein